MSAGSGQMCVVEICVALTGSQLMVCVYRCVSLPAAVSAQVFTFRTL